MIEAFPFIKLVQRPDFTEVVKVAIGRKLGKRERTILAHLLARAA